MNRKNAMVIITLCCSVIGMSACGKAALEGQNVAAHTEQSRKVTEVKEPTQVSEKTSNLNTQTSEFQIGTQIEKTAQLDVSYPVISGLEDKKIEMQLNTDLYRTAFEFNDENKVPNNDTSKMTYVATYEVTYNRNGILGVRFDVSQSEPEWAHPGTGSKSIVINIKNGNVYSLGELFKENSNYKNKLDALMKKEIQISNRYHDENIPEKATLPYVNLSVFKGIEEGQEYFIAKDTIVIYYPKYKYTSVAPLTFSIPFSSVTDILKVSL